MKIELFLPPLGWPLVESLIAPCLQMSLDHAIADDIVILLCRCEQSMHAYTLDIYHTQPHVIIMFIINTQ